MFRPSSLVLLGACLSLAACGSSAPSAGDAWAETGGNTNSPIAGQTLRCASDYPDSRLVFDRGGSLHGRFGGAAVSGRWHAPAPDPVQPVIRAGSISSRDRSPRTRGGWSGGTADSGGAALTRTGSRR